MVSELHSHCEMSYSASPGRWSLESAVADENRDRKAVYREIAVANGHPEWETEVQQTFARNWVKNARSGWYYQDASGNWRQK